MAHQLEHHFSSVLAADFDTDTTPLGRLVEYMLDGGIPKQYIRQFVMYCWEENTVKRAGSPKVHWIRSETWPHCHRTGVAILDPKEATCRLCLRRISRIRARTWMEKRGL